MSTEGERALLPSRISRLTDDMSEDFSFLGLHNKKRQRAGSPLTPKLTRSLSEWCIG